MCRGPSIWGRLPNPRFGDTYTLAVGAIGVPESGVRETSPEDDSVIVCDPGRHADAPGQPA